ncbi:MAG: hypothetical protein IJU60_05190 [Acholeplasmatales bacterium]|nr:hypothetical protein [Acholeplasmatales bacterium]
MAKIKKKRVSNVATKNQKKDNWFIRLLHNKIFLICGGIVLVAGITLAIVLPIVISNSKTEYKLPDYFGETQTYKVGDKDNEVKFTKINYSGVLEHTNANDGTYEDPKMFKDYVIVFATDLSAFHPKKYTDANGESQDANTNHQEAFNDLIQLQYTVNKYNETGDKKVALYIVDTKSATGSENVGILTNTKFGGSENGSDVLFFMYTADGLKKNFKESATVSNNLYSNTYDSTLRTAVDNVINYINEYVTGNKEEYKENN